MIAIGAYGLAKRYGVTLALDDVSFSLAEGAAYGLLGANGAGKSTLLRLIATLERPDAGQIVVLGQDVAAAPQEARRTIGFVPAEFGVERGITVGEHLNFFAQCRGLSRHERAAAVDTMLQLVDLQNHRHQLAIGLSRGLRQRLALATAMIHNPDILLLDDPLGPLDATGYEEMMEVLRELRSMGKTVVMSSQRVVDIRRLCDAAAILHQGRLVASGPIDEVLAERSSEQRLVVIEVAPAQAELARTVVLQMPEARDFVADRGRLTFSFDGNYRLLPSLLERLISARIEIREFATRGPDAEEGLARTLRELEV